MEFGSSYKKREKKTLNRNPQKITVFIRETTLPKTS
jgi:transposase